MVLTSGNGSHRPVGGSEREPFSFTSGAGPCRVRRFPPTRSPPMRRRDWLEMTAGGTALPLLLARPAGAQPADGKNLPALKITDVKVILTAPAGIRLAVVKVETNEPGLYGLGCATFTQRLRVVETAVAKFLKPFLVGKNPLAIEDLWQSMYVSS